MIFCGFCLIFRRKTKTFSFNKLIQFESSQVDSPAKKINLDSFKMIKRYGGYPLWRFIAF
jgi:hypothetical protein